MDVNANDIAEVTKLCAPPKDRGCDNDDRDYLNTLVLNMYGQMVIPCSMEEARDLYIELKELL